MRRFAGSVAQNCGLTLAIHLLLVALLSIGCSADGPAAAVTLGGVVCLDGAAACGEDCVKLASNAQNCGACGNLCGDSLVCDRGACVPAAAGCSAGRELCAGGCVDVATDRDNCGTCNEACAPEGRCAAGSCVCPGGLEACAAACADTQLDEEHCGACGTACVGGQTCDAGACACPAGTELCEAACVDTASDAEHCGSCGLACAGGQVCSGGACECPGNGTLCEDGCADIQTSTEHCGSCGVACSGGQVCSAGLCACPDGQDLCDGRCIDTRTDRANCGACGSACGLGEGCAASVCAGGALGEDGCQGLARNISIGQVAAYQTVKTELARDGASVEEREIDVVAGRETLVRAFVTPGQAWQPRELSARLHLENGALLTTEYSASTLAIGEASDEGDRETTFEFTVPKEQVTSQTRYAVEIVECGAGAGELLRPRFPASDGAPLEAVDAGGLRVHVVPLRANNRLPDTSEAALGVYGRAFLATYPISGIEFSVGQPVDIADPEDWTLTLDIVRDLRDREEPDPEVYYYGMLQPAASLREFCGNSCTAGVGFVPDGRFGQNASARAAVGLAYANVDSAFTMLHEVAHNHGRGHAPCVQGGSISGVDASYPYPTGVVGIYGYDSLGDELIAPDGATDLMGYCQNQWLSDYTYGGLLDAVLSVNRVQASLLVSPERIGAWRVVLLDAARGARWGRPIAAPRVAAGVPEDGLVLDAAGAPVTTVSVYRTEVADLGASSIQVPEPRPGWHSIQVSGAPPLPYPASP